MPRGNIDNFKGKRHKLTPEDNSKGGVNSGISRNKDADLRYHMEQALGAEVTDTKGNKRTVAESIAITHCKLALKGNVASAIFVRDTAGQKPVERVLTAEVDQSVIDEVESMVKDD